MLVQAPVEIEVRKEDTWNTLRELKSNPIKKMWITYLLTEISLEEVPKVTIFQ